MSKRDAEPVPEGSAPAAPPAAAVEVTESRTAVVGDMPVRRALPRRARRTVGAWCFVDHMGPAAVTEERGVDIGPHPHSGLQTVTWLFAGKVLHRDSLGSEQLIAPGQLNLMTAGHGVSHAEEATGRYRGELHGMQLWVAQPSSTRDGAPGFEHHAELPRVELGRTGAGSVIIGEFAGAASPARRDTDHLGVELDLGSGTATVPLERSFEYALVVADGAVTVDGQTVTPGHLAYLGLGRDECPFVTSAPARALLIGGPPFAEAVLMWWNYVARTQDEISRAHDDWTARGDRFGTVDSRLARIDVDPPPWSQRPPSDRATTT